VRKLVAIRKGLGNVRGQGQGREDGRDLQGHTPALISGQGRNLPRIAGEGIEA